MPHSNKWEQWDGTGFPASQFDAVIYYYPGKVDIEDPDNLRDLIDEIHMDGIAGSKSEAKRLLEFATVVHGQTTMVDGDLAFYSGSKDEYFDSTKEATWVELSSNE